jgi:hypothetical protein
MPETADLFQIWQAGVGANIAPEFDGIGRMAEIFGPSPPITERKSPGR